LSPSRQAAVPLSQSQYTPDPSLSKLTSPTPQLPVTLDHLSPYHLVRAIHVSLISRMPFLCGRITSITPQSDAYPDSIAFSQSRLHPFPIQARIASSIKSPARHANSLTYLVIPRPYPHSPYIPIRITRTIVLLTRIVFLTRSAGALHITSIVYLNVTLLVD
jgi:hypothetical protein